MARSTAEIVYDQAVRAVDQQVQQLDELRNRTAVVLAASGVITGFLGRAAIENGLGPFGFLAIVAFVFSALLCIWVLLPRWEAWEFSINARQLVPYFLDEDEPETPDSLARYLADEIQDDYDSNSKLLERLYVGLNWACVALAVEVVLWCLALGLDST
jgi:hypothetical protein